MSKVLEEYNINITRIQHFDRNQEALYSFPSTVLGLEFCSSPFFPLKIPVGGIRFLNLSGRVENYFLKRCTHNIPGNEIV